MHLELWPAEMKTKFKCLAFCFILIVVDGKRKQNSEPSFVFQSVECNSSNKSVSSYFCDVKSYNSTFKTLNAGSFMTRKIYDAKVFKLSTESST